MDTLIDLDFRVFYWVHVVGHNFIFDFLIPFIRNAYFWAPLYLFLGVVMVQNYKANGWYWLYYFFIAFALGDLFTNRFLKPLIHRTRPCIDYMWQDVHRHLVPNSVGYSFPSTHATNHFAMGVFIAITLGHKHKYIRFFAIAWAASIAYAQVYVGVHYPLDVLVGALLGSLIGYFMANYFNTRIGIL